ncbi:MAG: hypothetical protein R3A78_17010 [Polyangiales bacterium]
MPPGTALEVAAATFRRPSGTRLRPCNRGHRRRRVGAGYRTFEREIGVGAGDSEAVRIELVEAEVRAVPPVTERAPVVAVAPSDLGGGGGRSSAFPVLGWSFAGLAIAGPPSTVVFFVLTGGQSRPTKTRREGAVPGRAREGPQEHGRHLRAGHQHLPLGVTIGSAALAALFLLVLDDGEEAPSETGGRGNGLGLSGRF